MSADSIHFPDSMKYSTLANGRTVYGGGGIMPDVFIPMDTTRYSDYHRDIVAKGLMNRVELGKTYKKPQVYKEKFVVTDEIMNELKKMAEEAKITFKEEEYNRSLPLIQLQIKALIARDLYDMTEYFYIINDVNDSYQEALRILNDEERYHKIVGVKQ
jgi:carboxyl-terminal processing protease